MSLTDEELAESNRAWLRTLDLQMNLSTRELLLNAFYWVDKDMSGVLTMEDLTEFATALDPKDPDMEETVRGMLFAMSGLPTDAERAEATEIGKEEWLAFWDGPHLACGMTGAQVGQVMKNFDMLVTHSVPEDSDDEDVSEAATPLRRGS